MSTTQPRSLTRGRSLLRALRPVWDSAFRSPVVDGHVRLQGLSWTERQAARGGLVVLALLLGSLLFADAWRRGELLPIGDGDDLTFLPVGLLPVTLLCFVAAWVMLLWGALTAAWPVRLLVAALFLLTNPSLAVTGALDIGDHRAIQWGSELVTAGFFAAPGLLVASVGLRWLPPRAAARLLPALRLLIAAAVTVFFMTHLWVHVALSEEGFPVVVQQQVSGAVVEVDGLLYPLVYVAAILVIDFGLNMSMGVSESVREAPLRVGRWLLLGLLATKLWFVLFDELGDWGTYLADRPAAAVRTLVSFAVLAGMAWWVSRLPLTDRVDTAKERLLYLSSVALALPVVISVLVVGVGILLIARFGADEIPWFVRHYPAEQLADWLLPGLAALAFALGVLLLRRRRGPLDAELGSGLVCIAGWALPSFLLNQTDWELGFTDKLVDLAATLAVLAVVALRWGRLTTGQVTTLAAVAVFTWLAMTRGDWISLIGSWFALPATLVTIVGIVMSVSGDAAFTATGGRVMPQGSRVLMFVGYIVLTVTLLHWVETTHQSTLRDALSNSGFYFIGLPWAAWIVGRKLWHLQHEAPGEVL